MKANYVIITRCCIICVGTKNMRNYKFRLYPNDSQEYKLNNNLNVCKWVYNKFVEQAQKNFISQYDMQYMLTELKQSEPWLYNYHSKMLQPIASQVAGAEKEIGRAHV